jgi:hypothetical protein
VGNGSNFPRCARCRFRIRNCSFFPRSHVSCSIAKMRSWCPMLQHACCVATTGVLQRQAGRKETHDASTNPDRQRSGTPTIRNLNARYHHAQRRAKKSGRNCTGWGSCTRAKHSSTGTTRWTNGVAHRKGSPLGGPGPPRPPPKKVTAPWSGL